MRSKRIAKVPPCCIKLFFANLKLLMCRFHICTLIFVGSTGDERDKVFLALPLLGHIGIGKEVINNWICKHKLIKLINN